MPSRKFETKKKNKKTKSINTTHARNAQRIAKTHRHIHSHSIYLGISDYGDLKTKQQHQTCNHLSIHPSIGPNEYMCVLENSQSNKQSSFFFCFCFLAAKDFEDMVHSIKTSSIAASRPARTQTFEMCKSLVVRNVWVLKVVFLLLYLIACPFSYSVPHFCFFILYLLLAFCL